MVGFSTLQDLTQQYMTYIERAIEDAVKKGGYRDALLKANPNADIEGLADTGYFARNIEMKLIDPDFWSALGKARAWNEGNKGWLEEKQYRIRGKVVQRRPWKKYWHRFVDHLAEGKDAESFFKEIYKT